MFRLPKGEAGRTDDQSWFWMPLVQFTCRECTVHPVIFDALFTVYFSVVSVLKVIWMRIMGSPQIFPNFLKC